VATPSEVDRYRVCRYRYLWPQNIGDIDISSTAITAALSGYSHISLLLANSQRRQCCSLTSVSV